MARAGDGDGDGDGTGGTVLVVDDDRRVADLYARWIEDAGDYAARVVHDGTAAVDAVDDDGAVDAVVLDHDLPDATGEEVLTALRDRGHDLPAAMVTVASGDAGDTDVRRRLTKPVMREDVAATVATLLGDPGETGDDGSGLGLASATERDDAGGAADDGGPTATDRGNDGGPDGGEDAVRSDVSETLDGVSDRLDRIRESVGEEESDDGGDGSPDDPEGSGYADSGPSSDGNAESGGETDGDSDAETETATGTNPWSSPDTEADGGGERTDRDETDDETDPDTVFGLDASGPADDRRETGPSGESGDDPGPEA